jgi:DNA-binding transcriptional ArsR family regulator
MASSDATAGAAGDPAAHGGPSGSQRGTGRGARPETSAERTAFYQALTNPVRRKILSYLGYYGAANSASVARALGESTGTTSYHLRKLAEQRLVAEIPERSAGRERWWRPLPIQHQAAAPGEQSEAERAAYAEWTSQRLSDDIELYIRALADYDGPRGWVQGSRHGMFMTRDELLRFFGEYLDLLGRYGHDREDAPAGARAVAMRFLAAPALDEAPGPPPGTADHVRS